MGLYNNYIKFEVKIKHITSFYIELSILNSDCVPDCDIGIYYIILYFGINVFYI